MSLEGAKFICLDEAGNHGEIILAKGRKFTMGYYVSCDFVLVDERAKGVHCEIECDAFGRVTIRNLSPDKPILVNGSSVEIKRILLNNSKLSILDKDYLWQFPQCSSNEFEDIPRNTTSTPCKQTGIPEQPPNSCPDFKLHRDLPKRFTVHNFAYCIQSDEEGNISSDSNNGNTNEHTETNEAQSDNENGIQTKQVVSNKSSENTSHYVELNKINENVVRSITPKPSKEMAKSSSELLETPKMNLISFTENKENRSKQTKNKQLTLCHQSDIVITSFSPRETGVKIEKSFATIVKPKILITKLHSTPKSVYSTPKSDMCCGGNDDEIEENLINFYTPSTSKKGTGNSSVVNTASAKILKNSSMHLIDLTTPPKLRPASPYTKSALKAIAKKNVTQTIDKSCNKQCSEEQLGLTALPITSEITDTNNPLQTPSFVISVSSSSNASSIIEVTRDGSNLGITRGSVTAPITPLEAQTRTGAGTPKRTPQSLIKRAILTSAKKQNTTPQIKTQNLPTPRKESVNRIPLRSNLALLKTPITPQNLTGNSTISHLSRRQSMSDPTRKGSSVNRSLYDTPSSSNLVASSPSTSSRRSFLNSISGARALPTSTPLSGYGSHFRAACKTSLHKVRKSLDGVRSSHKKVRRQIVVPSSTSKIMLIKEKSPQQIMSDRLVTRARKSFCVTPISAKKRNIVAAVQKSLQTTPPSSSLLKEKTTYSSRKPLLFTDKQLLDSSEVDDLSRTFITDSDEQNAEFEKHNEIHVDATLEEAKKTQQTIEIPVDVEEITDSSKESKQRELEDTNQTSAAEGNSVVKETKHKLKNKEINAPTPDSDKIKIIASEENFAEIINHSKEDNNLADTNKTFDISKESPQTESQESFGEAVKENNKYVLDDVIKILDRDITNKTDAVETGFGEESIVETSQIYHSISDQYENKRETQKKSQSPEIHPTKYQCDQKEVNKVEVNTKVIEMDLRKKSEETKSLNPHEVENKFEIKSDEQKAYEYKPIVEDITLEGSLIEEEIKEVVETNVLEVPFLKEKIKSREIKGELNESQYKYQLCTSTKVSENFKPEDNLQQHNIIIGRNIQQKERSLETNQVENFETAKHLNDSRFKRIESVEETVEKSEMAENFTASKFESRSAKTAENKINDNLEDTNKLLEEIEDVLNKSDEIQQKQLIEAEKNNQDSANSLTETGRQEKEEKLEKVSSENKIFEVTEQTEKPIQRFEEYASNIGKIERTSESHSSTEVIELRKQEDKNTNEASINDQETKKSEENIKELSGLLTEEILENDIYSKNEENIAHQTTKYNTLKKEKAKTKDTENIEINEQIVEKPENIVDGISATPNQSANTIKYDASIVENNDEVNFQKISEVKVIEIAEPFADVQVCESQYQDITKCEYRATESESNKNILTKIETSKELNTDMKKIENAASFTPRRSIRRASQSVDTPQATAELLLTPRRSARRSSLSAESAITFTPTKRNTRRASLSMINEIPLTPKPITKRGVSISMDDETPTPSTSRIQRAKTPCKQLEQCMNKGVVGIDDVIIETEEEPEVVQFEEKKRQVLISYNDKTPEPSVVQTPRAKTPKKLMEKCMVIQEKPHEDVSVIFEEEIVSETERFVENYNENNILDNEETSEELAAKVKPAAVYINLEKKPMDIEELLITQDTSSNKKEFIALENLTEEETQEKHEIYNDIEVKDNEISKHKQNADEENIEAKAETPDNYHEEEDNIKSTIVKGVEEVDNRLHKDDTMLPEDDLHKQLKTTKYHDIIALKSSESHKKKETLSGSTKLSNSPQTFADDNIKLELKNLQTPTEKDKTPAKDLSSSLRDIETKMSTPKIKKSLKILDDSPKTPCMSGMSELLKTPKTEVFSPRLEGIRDLVRTPKNDLESELKEMQNLSAVADLVKTPVKKLVTIVAQSPQTPLMKGMRELLKTPKSEVNTPKLVGLRHLVQTPKSHLENEQQEIENNTMVTELDETSKDCDNKNIIDEMPSSSTKFKGVKELLKTPKSCSTPRFRGIRELMQTRKMSLTPTTSGVKDLLGSPVTQESKDLQTAAVKLMESSEIAENLVSNESVEEIISSSSNIKLVKELVKTPNSSLKSSFMISQESMQQTPKIDSTPSSDAVNEHGDNDSPVKRKDQELEKFLKTPTARNIMIPSMPSSAVIEKSSDSIEISTEYDLNATNEDETANLREIFKTPAASHFAESIAAGSFYSQDEVVGHGETKQELNTTKNETLQDTLNKTAEEAFDKLLGQETQIETPIRKVYARKSFTLQTPQSQSPFASADVLSDLPKTDVEEWIEALYQAEPPTILECDDSEEEEVVQQDINESTIQIVGDLSASEISSCEKYKPNINESIIPETCAKVYLTENSFRNKTTTFLTHTEATKDPLSNSNKKIEERETRLQVTPPIDAEISGINLLDETLESVQDEPSTVEEHSILEEPLIVSDNESESESESQNTLNKRVDVNEASQDVDNDLSEPLILSDSEDLNVSREAEFTEEIVTSKNTPEKKQAEKRNDEYLETSNIDVNIQEKSMLEKLSNVVDSLVEDDPLETSIIVVEEDNRTLLEIDVSQVEDECNEVSTSKTDLKELSVSVANERQESFIDSELLPEELNKKQRLTLEHSITNDNEGIKMPEIVSTSKSAEIFSTSPTEETKVVETCNHPEKILAIADIDAEIDAAETHIEKLDAKEVAIKEIKSVAIESKDVFVDTSVTEICNETSILNEEHIESMKNSKKKNPECQDIFMENSDIDESFAYEAINEENNAAICDMTEKTVLNVKEIDIEKENKITEKLEASKEEESDGLKILEDLTEAETKDIDTNETEKPEKAHELKQTIDELVVETPLKELVFLDEKQMETQPIKAFVSELKNTEEIGPLSSSELEIEPNECISQDSLEAGNIISDKRQSVIESSLNQEIITIPKYELQESKNITTVAKDTIREITFEPLKGSTTEMNVLSLSNVVKSVIGKPSETVVSGTSMSVEVKISEESCKEAIDKITENEIEKIEDISRSLSTPSEIITYDFEIILDDTSDENIKSQDVRPNRKKTLSEEPFAEISADAKNESTNQLNASTITSICSFKDDKTEEVKTTTDLEETKDSLFANDNEVLESEIYTVPESNEAEETTTSSRTGRRKLLQKLVDKQDVAEIIDHQEISNETLAADVVETEKPKRKRAISDSSQGSVKDDENYRKTRRGGDRRKVQKTPVEESVAEQKEECEGLLLSTNITEKQKPEEANTLINPTKNIAESNSQIRSLEELPEGKEDIQEETLIDLNAQLIVPKEIPEIKHSRAIETLTKTIYDVERTAQINSTEELIPEKQISEMQSAVLAKGDNEIEKISRQQREFEGQSMSATLEKLSNINKESINKIHPEDIIIQTQTIVPDISIKNVTISKTSDISTDEQNIKKANEKSLDDEAFTTTNKMSLETEKLLFETKLTQGMERIEPIDSPVELDVEVQRATEIQPQKEKRNYLKATKAQSSQDLVEEDGISRTRKGRHKIQKIPIEEIVMEGINEENDPKTKENKDVPSKLEENNEISNTDICKVSESNSQESAEDVKQKSEIEPTSGPVATRKYKQEFTEIKFVDQTHNICKDDEFKEISSKETVSELPTTSRKSRRRIQVPNEAESLNKEIKTDIEAEIKIEKILDVQMSEKQTPKTILKQQEQTEVYATSKQIGTRRRHGKVEIKDNVAHVDDTNPESIDLITTINEIKEKNNEKDKELHQLERSTMPTIKRGRLRKGELEKDVNLEAVEGISTSYKTRRVGRHKTVSFEQSTTVLPKAPRSSNRTRKMPAELSITTHQQELPVINEKELEIVDKIQTDAKTSPNEISKVRNRYQNRKTPIEEHPICSSSQKEQRINNEKQMKLTQLDEEISTESKISKGGSSPEISTNIEVLAKEHSSGEYREERNKSVKKHVKRGRTGSDSSHGAVVDEKTSKKRPRYQMDGIEEYQDKDVEYENTETQSEIHKNDNIQDHNTVEGMGKDVTEYPQKSTRRAAAIHGQHHKEASVKSRKRRAGPEDNENHMDKMMEPFKVPGEDALLPQVEITVVNVEPETSLEQHTYPEEVNQKEVTVKKGRKKTNLIENRLEEHEKLPATNQKDNDDDASIKRRVGRRKQFKEELETEVNKDAQLESNETTSKRRRKYEHEDHKKEKGTPSKNSENLSSRRNMAKNEQNQDESHDSELKHTESSEATGIHGKNKLEHKVEEEEEEEKDRNQQMPKRNENDKELTNTANSSDTLNKRNVSREKHDQEDHNDQNVSSEINNPQEETKKGKGRRKKIDHSEELEQPESLQSPETKQRGRRRKESHTDSHDQSDEKLSKEPETKIIISSAIMEPQTPHRTAPVARRGRKAIDHITAESQDVEDTPGRRARNVPQRRAATAYHNYDETSDSEVSTKTKNKTDTPKKSLESAVVRTPTVAITSAPIVNLSLSPTSTPSVVTARGRTRRPTAKVQQFLEKERAKAETPKRKGLLAVSTGTNRATPERTPARRGQKAATVELEVEETPKAIKSKGRGRPAALHTKDDSVGVPVTSTVVEETKIDLHTITPPANTIKGRRGVRKAKITEEEIHDNNEPPKKKSPVQLESEKQLSITSVEVSAPPTRVAGRRNAAAAAKARIEEDALAAAAIEPPKKTRAKKAATKISTPIAATTDIDADSSEVEDRATKVEKIAKNKNPSLTREHRLASASTIEGIENVESLDDIEVETMDKPPATKRGRKVATATTIDSPAVSAKRGRKAKTTVEEVAESVTPTEPKSSRSRGRGRKIVHFDEDHETEAPSSSQQNAIDIESMSIETSEPVKRGTRTRRK